MILISSQGYSEKDGMFDLTDLEMREVENDVLHGEVVQYQYALGWVTSCLERLSRMTEPLIAQEFQAEIDAALGLAEALKGNG